MPYIPLDKRITFEPELSKLTKKLKDAVLTSKGDLTYVVYYLALKSITTHSYTALSNSISCLNDAAEEIRRLHLNRYEDKKIIENGGI